MQTDSAKVDFYAPTYLKTEISRHFPKIIARSGLPEATVHSIIELVYTRITFIDDALIPWEHYRSAARLVRDIDPFDVQFVALTQHLNEIL